MSRVNFHFYLKQAEAFLALQKYHEAIEQFRMALRHRPTEIMVYLNLGNLLFKTGQTKLALDVLYQGSLISMKIKKYSKAVLIYDLMRQIDENHKFTRMIYKDIKIFQEKNLKII